MTLPYIPETTRSPCRALLFVGMRVLRIRDGPDSGKAAGECSARMARGDSGRGLSDSPVAILREPRAAAPVGIFTTRSWSGTFELGSDAAWPRRNHLNPSLSPHHKTDPRGGGVLFGFAIGQAG